VIFTSGKRCARGEDGWPRLACRRPIVHDSRPESHAGEVIEAMRSDIDPLLVDRLARILVEAAIVDRATSGRRPRVLNDEDQATGLGTQFLLAMWVAVPEHGSGPAQPVADPEFALQDVPDLREVMTMPRVP